MSMDLTDDKSTLVQVMAWCRQATSHYMIHSPDSITWFILRSALVSVGMLPSQISERSDNFNTKYRGFEISRDPVVRRLTTQWALPQTMSPDIGPKSHFHWPDNRLRIQLIKQGIGQLLNEAHITVRCDSLSRITVYLNVYSGADQRNHQSSVVNAPAILQSCTEP